MNNESNNNNPKTAEALPQAADEQQEEHPTFEEAVAELTSTVNHAPLHREIFLRLLTYCKTQRTLHEAEQAVAAMPEFPAVAQTPYRLIRSLVAAGGLDWLELDAEGVPLTSQDKENLTDDEIEDATFAYAVKTTPFGEQVAEDLAPEKRLANLFKDMPSRLSAFRDVMGFCRDPRTFKEVDAFLRARGGDTLASASGQDLNPSYFVDMLERAGGLVWDNGWKVTRCGAKMLQTIA